MSDWIYYALVGSRKVANYLSTPISTALDIKSIIERQIFIEIFEKHIKGFKFRNIEPINVNHLAFNTEHEKKLCKCQK